MIEKIELVQPSHIDPGSEALSYIHQVAAKLNEVIDRLNEPDAEETPDCGESTHFIGMRKIKYKYVSIYGRYKDTEETICFDYCPDCGKKLETQKEEK